MGTDADVHARTRTDAFVCVHIIKGPDMSARIISDASGRVFGSRTFEVYYTSANVSLLKHEAIRTDNKKKYNNIIISTVKHDF